MKKTKRVQNNLQTWVHRHSLITTHDDYADAMDSLQNQAQK